MRRYIGIGQRDCRWGWRLGLTWLSLVGLVACSSSAVPAHTAVPSPIPATAADVPIPSSTPAAHPPALQPTLASPTITATFQPTPQLPIEHFITGITGHRQFFPLGCETAAALDWARYFGDDFNEFEFQYALPQSDNPELGFVGDVRSPWGQIPPYGYGVHAGPVADLLNEYGIPAEAVKGYSLEQVQAQLAAKRPVIAWVIGNMVGGTPHEYTDSQGQTVIVAPYEHVVVLTGYSASSIRYMNNGKFYEVPHEVFLTSWGVLGNMAIVAPAEQEG